MGKLTRIGYARLDALIAEHGEEWLGGQIITRIADGDNPMEIARSLGVHYVCLKRWMEEHAADDVAFARMAFADGLVAEALGEMKNADVDNLQVAKARADVYLKVAGKASKVEWGDGAQVGGGGMGSITIVIGDVVKEQPNVITQEEI